MEIPLSCVSLGYLFRNNESFHPTKENATNVINALLNYGYAVLASEVAKYVNAFGLDISLFENFV